MPLNSRRLAGIPQLEDASRNSPSLKKGAKGDGVAALQDVLADLRFDMSVSFRRNGRADGIFGDETDRAVRAFQSRQGLAADGAVGTRTLAALDALIVATPGLDAPDPAAVQRQEAADRHRPLSERRRAQL